MPRSATAAPSPGYQLLLPTMVIAPRDCTLPLALLPPDDDLSADPPDAALVASIKVYGTVLQPVLLFEHETRFTIADGRRRVMAARAAGLTTIRAWVLPPGSVDPASVALLGNALRSDNLLSDYGAIRHLAAQGAGEGEIRRAAGLSASAYKARLRLDALIPEFKEVLRTRTKAIRSRVLHEIAKLTPEQQQRLWAIYCETGTVTVDTITEARRVRHGEAVAALPDALFETPGLAAPTSWHTTVRLLLTQARAATPASAPTLCDAIETALGTLAGLAAAPSACASAAR